MITLDTTYMKKIKKSNVDKAYKTFLKEKKMSFWHDNKVKSELLEEMKKTSEELSKNEVVIVLGMGGSILGTKAILTALSCLNKVIFPCETYEDMDKIKDIIEENETLLLVISKSGNTKEVNDWFDFLYPTLENKYKEKIQEHLVVITDIKKGLITSKVKDIPCKKYHFEEELGGRFSTPSPVSILPMYLEGVDVDEFLCGYYDGLKDLNIKTYVSIRDMFYREGYTVELLNVYSKKLEPMADYIQQVLAETQGKKNKGLLPVPVLNPSKLHSLGQFSQEGTKCFFETTIGIKDDIATSVAKAHFQDKRYTTMIYLDSISTYNIGYLIGFYYMSAMLGAYLLGVNYYDQNGVEKYKEILKQL